MLYGIPILSARSLPGCRSAWLRLTTIRASRCWNGPTAAISGIILMRWRVVLCSTRPSPSSRATSFHSARDIQISVGKRTGGKPRLPAPAAAGDAKFSHLHPMNLCKLAHEVGSSLVHFLWLGQISNDFCLPGHGHLPVTRKGSQHVIVPKILAPRLEFLRRAAPLLT